MKSKGFTLIELVVAMTVSAVLAVGIVSLMALALSNYRKTRIEAQVQIEGQTISEYIKSTLQGCNSYYFTKGSDANRNEAFLAVNTRIRIDPGVYDKAIVGWYYFYFDLDSRLCYVTFRDTKLGDDELLSSIFTDTDEKGNSIVKGETYLGQYVESINIIPKNYSSKNEERIKKYKYNTTLQLYLRNIDYEQQIDSVFKIRSR